MLSNLYYSLRIISIQDVTNNYHENFKILIFNVIRAVKGFFFIIF